MRLSLAALRLGLIANAGGAIPTQRIRDAHHTAR
jgi:hypothetical protein